jgi:hypothetical protein
MRILIDLLVTIFGGEDAAYNRQLEKDGLVNRDVVQHTTIGWRPDPFHEQDGYTQTGPNEYSRVVRGGKKGK